MRHCVAYQEIYHVLNTKIFGYEFLSRWITDLGVVKHPSYLKNINWCEIDLKVIHWFEQYVLEHHLGDERALYFINASAELLVCEDGFRDWLESLKKIENVGIRCVIEITENIPDNVLSERFFDVSCVVSYMALDDFSRNYSTLERLSKYKWDFCKFNVDDLSKSVAARAIDICKNTDINMVSERVEGVHQLRHSLSKGLALQQGYLWHRPVTINHLESVSLQTEVVA